MPYSVHSPFSPRNFRAASLGLTLTLLLAIGPRAGAQIDLESGLQLYYTFDEGAGDRVGDLSGNLRTGQIFDAAQFQDSEILWTEGRFGRGVDMDGTYFLSVPDWFGIGGKGARTISMWVNAYIPPASTTVLVGWGPNVAQQRWHFKFQASNSGVRTENQGGNIFGSIPVVDGTWHHIVSVFPEGGETLEAVDHYVDGVLDPEKNGGITNPVNTVADPSTGVPVTIGGSPFNAGFRFAITMIDDVRVYNRALSPEEIAALAAGEGVLAGAPPIITPPEGVEGNPFVNPESGFTFSAVPATSGSTIASVAMTLNGTDVTSELNVMPGGLTTTAMFDNLEPDVAYSVELRATDDDGLISSRKFSFATFSETSFTIEAEDYNFDGGQFIDDPLLCNVLGGMDDCYFDRISVPGVDSFDSSGFSDDSSDFDNIYRYSRGTAEREEEFDTIRATDLPRTKHTESGVDDYEINLLQGGDWANYTRTFPDADAFQIILRARATAPQIVRLDKVSNPATAEQEVTLLGTFLVPASSSYAFVPLTDLSGEKELTVKLTGDQTLRLTAVEANNNLSLNYLMFIPSTDTAILPTVSITEPANNSVFPEGATITLRTDTNDEDGFVTSVAFTVIINGVETELATATEAPFEFAWSDLSEGVYSITAKATDNDGLEGLSQPITVIVDSTPPVITSLRESPGIDAIEIIFSESLDAASAEVIANYQITPSLAISSANASGRRVILATAPQTAGEDYTITIQGVKDANGIAQSGNSASFTAGDSTLLYGLEVYLPFDESSGNAASDLSGHGRDAGMYNADAFAALPVLWADGRFGGAVDFNGGYFLGVPGYYGIGGAEPRTISMWIKTDWVVPNGANALMGWGRNVRSERWHFKLEQSANGALRTENQGGNVFGSIPVNDGEWHHIVAVFPEFGAVVGDVEHYVDGVLDEVRNGSTGTEVNTNIDPLLAPILTVGGAPLGAELRTVTAVLDDVRLYNRALTPDEIQALFEGEGVLNGVVDRPTLAIERTSSGQVSLTWERGILQTTSTIGGSWSEVDGAGSPHTVDAEGTAFFRIVVP